MLSVRVTPIEFATFGSSSPSPRSGSMPNVFALEDSQLRMLVSPELMGFGNAEILTSGSGCAVTVIAALAEREPYSLVAMMM